MLYSWFMTEVPFYKKLPYRNINLNLSEAPYPQENHDDWDISNMTMNDYDLFICEEGSADFYLNRTVYKLEPGTALLVPPHCLVNAKKTSREAVKMTAQHFMLYLFQKTDLFTLIKYEPLICFSDWDFILFILAEIKSIVASGKDKWLPLDTTPLFMVILTRFIEAAYQETNIEENRKSSLVLDIISEIEEDYKNPLLLEKMMELSEYGYSHTSNIFKDYTGISIKSYIIERRLDAAKEALLRRSSVRSAAEAAGYEDEFYFSRIFKKYTGASPREFRKRI
jgi:YesN/AraC family two-component response regulator